MAKTTIAHPEPGDDHDSDRDRKRERDPDSNREPDSDRQRDPHRDRPPDPNRAPGRDSPRDPDTDRNADSDPDSDGWLGDFRRGPAVFSLHRLGPESGAHPLAAPDYRIECNDGAGPRIICRFADESEAIPEWFGAWQGDEWCDWILEQARTLIADPQNT